MTARPSDPSRGSACRIEAKRCMALTTVAMVEHSLVGERLERRERDVAPVDFEEAGDAARESLRTVTVCLRATW